MFESMLLMLQAAQAPAALAAPSEFHLICEGVNDATATHVQLGVGAIGRVAGVTGGVSSEHYQTVPEEALIDIAGTIGRVRFPARLVNQTWHRSGWMDLADVRIEQDQITAKVQFSWSLHPLLSIDRRTGSVYYKNMLGNYEGKCRIIDPNEHAF